MNRNKTVIAITGGIGSGKSAVCDILTKHGEKCISCDKINAELLLSDDYLNGLKAIFPDAFCDGKLNKRILKEYVAYSTEKKKALDKYSHSKIKDKMLEEIASSDEARVFVEVPVLNQTDYAALFDKIWVITSNPHIRCERIINRDSVDGSFALAMMNAQSEEYDYGDKTVPIRNDGDMDALEKIVLALIGK